MHPTFPEQEMSFFIKVNKLTEDNRLAILIIGEDMHETLNYIDRKNTLKNNLKNQ